MIERDALQIALELFRSPLQVRSVQRLPLPKGVLQVIRIAAGDELDESVIEATFGWKEPDVRAAAVFFLQQILFEKGSNPFRLLGLSHDANLEDLKNHRRALLKWLHPDRNVNKWESVLLQRVIGASNIVTKTFEGKARRFGRTELASAATPPDLLQPKQRRNARRGMETKKYRKSIELRGHLFSFLKRTGTLVVAVAVGLLGLQALAKPNAPQQIIGFARSMFAWVD